LVFTIFAAIAEFERELIRQRVKSGLAVAKAKGTKLGRPRAGVDKGKVEALRASGASWREVAEKLGVGLGTVYRIAHPRSSPEVLCA
jgi:DNA invertase Pin-like site-specific DNA recombinase